MGYRSTNCTVHSAKYHLIWCPKYRRRVLSGDVEDRLQALPGLWTRSWFVSSVGGAPLEVVRRYVENQKLAV